MPPVRRKNDAAAAPGNTLSLKERTSRLLLKPAVAEATAEPEPDLTIEELKDTYLYADDKERAIGLIAAPVAALIGILIVSSRIHHDPSAILLHGKVNPRHVSVALYDEVMAVFAVLSVGMLGCAWFRKRLYLGMVMALYAVTVFNLHNDWGFAIPFVLVASWYLVRAYRFSRELKAAGLSPRTVTRKTRAEEEPVVPTPGYDAKRFTPHTSPRRRTSAIGR